MAEVLVVGCGYAGRRLALTLRDAGHAVTGTTRSEARAARLEALGIRPLLLDLGPPGAARALLRSAPDVCFYLAPPVPARGEGTHAGSGPADAAGPAAEVEEVIRALVRAPLQAFVYASSTSVYGDRGGARVDERDVPAPDSPAGRARLAAERRVLRAGWDLDCRPRIARISGIYGPGRTLREAIREGRYHLIEGVESWSNRIHVDDLVRALLAVWLRGANGGVYNVTDDEPHPSGDFARLVAELCGLELPVLTADEARERYGPDRLARKLGSKRVSNRRLREGLGLELRYPTFREGVPAALAEEEEEEGEESGEREGGSRG